MPRRTHPFLSAALAATLLVSPAAAPALAAPGTHVVEQGDTLWRIAQNAAVDPAALAAANNLTDTDILRVGQTLSIPGAAAPAVPAASTHTVAEGETLWGIAHQNGTTVDAMVQANGLASADEIKEGQTLQVPGRSAPAPAPAPAPQPSPAPAAPAGEGNRSLVASYTVQKGDTLASIARKYGVTTDAIARATGLEDPNRLATGSVVKVPLPGRERVVQAGETLFAIAEQEKVDLGSLIEFNGIGDPRRLHPGDVVLVPAIPLPERSAAAPAPTPAPAPAPTPAPAPAPAAAPATAARAASVTAVGTPAPASTPAPKPAVAAPTITADDGLVGGAKKLVGLSYRWAGADPSGFDCSGLIWYLARQVGKSVPRDLQGQYDAGSHPKREDLQPGDLVFFENTYMPGLSHNGIYIGGNQFVHAADEDSGVTISSMTSSYWSSRYYGATRLK